MSFDSSTMYVDKFIKELASVVKTLFKKYFKTKLFYNAEKC